MALTPIFWANALKKHGSRGLLLALVLAFVVSIIFYTIYYYVVPGFFELSIVVEVVDVVVDCSDNFATRFLLNEVTQELKTPLVSGAAIRMEGQVTVYDPRQSGSACYRCLYQDNGELQQTCSEIGVLSPLLGIIGSVQAVETIKLIAGIGKTLAGRLLILDALSMTWQEIKLRQDPHCPICNKATQ
ncbi:MAG TPA: hypothetical protein ENK70_02920 [Methylophaga sp.]|nr:hypothetical protein [Methylophaga sp.]